jgi:histidinol-phosphate aminotransferase
MVVVDEAYIDFAESSSWTTRLSDYPNLVVVQTLSKAYGLAGIRLGMLMADPRVISALNRIKPPYNVNQLTQERALERLSEGSVKQEISLLLSERERLERELIKIPMVSVVYPSDANFLLVQVDDANKRYAELIGQGLVLRNRTNQPGCANTLRITIGTEAENDKLLDTLQKIS